MVQLAAVLSREEAAASSSVLHERSVNIVKKTAGPTAAGESSKQQKQQQKQETAEAGARKALALATQGAIAKAKATSAASRLHSKAEASLLVKDADLHSWLRKRQKRGEAAKPRAYMTRHRRETLKSAFESIDRDGSGTIDRGELIFALQQLGLDLTHAEAIFLEGDEDGDGEITLDEFFKLVATVSAREHQREVLAQQQQLAQHEQAIKLQQQSQKYAVQAVYTDGTRGVGGGEQIGKVSTAVAAKQQQQHAKQQAKAKPDQLTPRTQQEVAVAGSVSELVSRAAAFPIGLLANAQQLSSLVSHFDPEGYASRVEVEGQELGKASSLGGLGRAVVAANRLKLPALPPAARGVKAELARAASAPPLKSSSAHSRWLQRAATAKGGSMTAQGSSTAAKGSMTAAKSAEAANAPPPQQQPTPVTQRKPISRKVRPASSPALPQNRSSKDAASEMSASDIIPTWPGGSETAQSFADGIADALRSQTVGVSGHKTRLPSIL